LKSLPCKLLGAGLVTAFLLFLFAPAALAQAKEKQLTFQASAMPWKELFSWLADRTGTPVITQGKTPMGSFDLISPQGTKYTIIQALDLINVNLMEQKFLLVRKSNAFVLVSLDKKLPAYLVPRLKDAKDLERLGKTEVVSLQLKLPMPVDEVSTELKKLQGPMGEMLILSQANQMILQDSVENIERILKHIEDIQEATAKAENGFEVFQLMHADAIEVSKILADGFNGSKMVMHSEMVLRGRPPEGDKDAKKNIKERIRIVPDLASNKLLIRAAPADLELIRDLITKHLDIKDDSSEVLIKTFVIGPLKHTNADDVADVIKDVYKESMRENQLQQRHFLRFAGMFNPKRPIDPNGNPKGVMLSLGVDTRTNSLILSCSTTMKTDIETLINMLEKAAEDSSTVSGTQVVDVIQVKGVDPKVFQQAIDAIQGRRVGGASGGMNMPGWPFFGGFGRPGGFMGGPGQGGPGGRFRQNGG
jgi:type II secretory pathway component GspD/PulD (secretin)